MKAHSVPYKAIKFITLFVVITIVTSVVLFIRYDRTFDSLPDIQSSKYNHNLTDRVKIGIIGDSWVAGQKLDRSIHESFQQCTGLYAKVISCGHPGAKSRQIFRDLISGKSNPYSSSGILNDDKVDYLVIVAGVNDTAGHIGADFYSYHIFSITTLAQSFSVFPIIVEVPEYGIEDTPSKGFFSYSKRLIYRCLFDSFKINVIADYRQALMARLSQLPSGTFAVVSFDQVVADYSHSRDLYANPSHLNQVGYAKLGTYIGKAIAEAHDKRLDTTAFRKDGENILLSR